MRRSNEISYTRELRKLRTRLRTRSVDVYQVGKKKKALKARDGMALKARDVLYRSLDSAREASIYLEISAEVLQLEGRYEEALDDLFEAINLINSHKVPQADLGRLNAQLGTLLDIMGRSEEAKGYYLRCLEYLGTTREEVIAAAQVKNNLAILVKSEGDWEQAKNYYKDALGIIETEKFDDEELAASIYYNYAVLLQQEGEKVLSAELFAESLETRQRIFGDQHVDTAASHAAVAIGHALKGEDGEALQHFGMAEPIMRKNVGQVREEYEFLVQNYCIFLRNIGLTEQANEVQRVASKA